MPKMVGGMDLNFEPKINILAFLLICILRFSQIIYIMLKVE